MKRVETFETVTIEVPWEMWCRLGIRGQNWLRSVASKGQQLPCGGWRIEMADYRLKEFVAMLEGATEAERERCLAVYQR